MTTVEAIRAEALFVSWLQASERPAPEQVRAVVATTLRGRGVRGCAAAVAEEFGDHPDRAVARMGWALTTVSAAYRPAANEPGRRQNVGSAAQRGSYRS